MDRQVARFDELNDRGQELVQLLNNDAGTVVTINEHLQRFQERWDSLVQHMEQQSKEVRTAKSATSDIYSSGRFMRHNLYMYLHVYRHSKNYLMQCMSIQ